MSQALDTILRRPSDVRFRHVKDECVVIRQKDAEVLVLNRWAGRVLELLDGLKTLREVADMLEGEFDADLETIRTDVLRFATELEAAGLTEPVNGENR